MTQPATRSLSDQWAEEGYCLYRSLLSADDVADLLRITERVRRQWLAASAEDGKPGDPDRHNMRHLNHPGYFRDHPDEFVTLMNLIADERILAFARKLLDGEPVFRATTLWFEPKTAHEDGSWHRDVQFMNPDEAQQQSIIAARSKPGGIQLQIALVETSDNEYVPGSHLRWDTEEEYRIRLADEQVNSRANDMPGAIRIHQRPGDALAFEALGLHRGRYHTDKRRRTLMLTYTSDRERIFDYFSDQPWILSPVVTGYESPSTALPLMTRLPRRHACVLPALHRHLRGRPAQQNRRRAAVPHLSIEPRDASRKPP